MRRRGISDSGIIFGIVMVVIFFACLGIGGCLIGGPHYNVYVKRMEGEAALAQSLSAKQVMVQDAIARLDSAKSLADAEVVRAEGVAKANKIIGDSLNNNEAYIKYLFVDAIKDNNNVVYVATEAGIPIMEAGARFQPKVPKPQPGAPGTAEHPEAANKE